MAIYCSLLLLAAKCLTCKRALASLLPQVQPACFHYLLLQLCCPYKTAHRLPRILGLNTSGPTHKPLFCLALLSLFVALWPMYGLHTVVGVTYKTQFLLLSSIHPPCHVLCAGSRDKTGAACVHLSSSQCNWLRATPSPLSSFSTLSPSCILLQSSHINQQQHHHNALPKHKNYWLKSHDCQKAHNSLIVVYPSI